MIKLNLENAFVSEKQINSYRKQIKTIHNNIINRKGTGSKMLDWIDWPDNYYEQDFKNMVQKNKELKKLGVEILLVIGVGGSFLSAKAGIDFVLGTNVTETKVLFIGTDFSGSHIKQIESKLETKEWAICVISKSGTTLETSLAFRYFRKLLINKYQENHFKYVVAITDVEKGILKEIAAKENYFTLPIPSGIGGRFSGLTFVGLFPMLFAGINYKDVLLGASKSCKDNLNPNLANNDAFRYAVTRNILSKKLLFYQRKPRYSLEIFTIYDYDLLYFSEWFKQLIAESEGKNGKGIFPVSAFNTRELHSLGQYLQDGQKIFFQTTLWINEDFEKLFIEAQENDDDNLNYLAGKSFHEINTKAFNGIIDAHANIGKNPNIIINLKNRSAEALGYVWYFFFISTIVSSYLLNINPFDQPGVEIYKQKMFSLLGKPK